MCNNCPFFIRILTDDLLFGDAELLIPYLASTERVIPVVCGFFVKVFAVELDMKEIAVVNPFYFYSSLLVRKITFHLSVPIQFNKFHKSNSLTASFIPAC